MWKKWVIPQWYTIRKNELILGVVCANGYRQVKLWTYSMVDLKAAKGEDVFQQKEGKNLVLLSQS